MPKPAFIVEGQLEQHIVRLACPDHKVVLLGVNGDKVAMKTIALRIETHFTLFSNRYFPVVVIFDREKRTPTSAELKAELIAELHQMDIPTDQFLVFISDRDIECMFVAHIDENGSYVDTGCPLTHSVDGMDGESELRKRLARQNQKYHKTTTGVELFKRVRPFIVATKSKNFRRFQSEIAIICPWARM